VRRFFAQVEQKGAGPMLASELAFSAEEEAALRAEGIVGDAALAERWECGEIGCARLVVQMEDGFVAVCTRESDLCETVELSREELRRVHVSLAALLEVVRRELRIVPPQRAASEATGPLHLGEQGTSSPRDVFLELHPRPASLAPFLALREHAPRATLVLVPALASLASEVVVGHATGAKVEIDALGEALAVRGGKIRAAPRLRSARAPIAAVALVTGAPPATLVPRARQWAHLTILAIDKHTVLVKVGWRRQRLTYVDVGFAAKNSRQPTTQWLMLLAICAGHGEFKWQEFGSFGTAKTEVTRLRKRLSAAFGVDENPFHPFSYAQGWRARFQAGMWSEDDESALQVRAPRTWGADGEPDVAEAADSAWGVAFEDWEGKALPGRATRAPRDD
jgi:hypothetical protein